jgi:hypothetical protein
MTQEQVRALLHARELLTKDNGPATLGDRDWHRLCRLALWDILAAFEGELP